MSLRENLAHSMNIIRAARQLSICEFSEELYVARSTMQDILSGTGNPRMDTVEHIAEQLHMDPISLLCDNEQNCPLLFPSLLHGLEFFDRLPAEEQSKLTYHLLEIATILGCKQ